MHVIFFKPTFKVLKVLFGTMIIFNEKIWVTLGNLL